MSPNHFSGAITFLFTDIEGSTQLWERHPEAMKSALARHDAIMRQSIESQGGYVFKTVGDGFHAAFATAPQALAAALAAQHALYAEAWGETPIKVRMAFHTDVAEERDGDYFGPPLNRVARLMSAGHGGQILLSSAAQELIGGHLPEGTDLRDMGERRLKDLVRPERIFQLVVSDLPADFPPLKTLDAFRTNLPAQLTSFIGREKEMVEVKRLIAASRLVTLVGPGGTGKTRLSLQATADLLEVFSDGLWFIEFAPLADPELVPQTVAVTLGLREEVGRPIIASLCDYLREKKALLILDNCEHLVDASAQLAEALLRACPNVHILASSREVLGVAGEMPYRVASLSTPDPRKLPPTDTLARYEAVRLFVNRAATALPGFTLTSDNASAIAHITRRLDGIPLALELAAARVKVLRVEQIAARLDDRFRLLTGGNRTALPRQQTLRALIDWSFDLLPGSERLVLRRLSAFAGGWTLEAAESVCAGEGVEVFEVLDLLTQLANKSLVLVEREQSKETRYRTLETIRQYSREKMLEVGEGEVVRGRHFDYFVRLAEAAEPELTRANQAVWFRRLEDEVDNLRAALEWGSEHEPLKGLRLVGSLGRFLVRQGYINEGIERLTHLLAQPEALSRTAERAKALGAGAVMAGWQNDFNRARALAEESLSLYQDLGDQEGEAFSLRTLGTVVCLMGDYAFGRPRILESLALFRRLKNKQGIAETLIDLGGRWDNNDYARARAYLEEGLMLFREQGDATGIADALESLGNLALWQGDFALAHSSLEESLEMQRSLAGLGFAEALQHLGELALREGDYQKARTLLERGMSIDTEAGRGMNSLWALAKLGYVALREGNIGSARATLAEAGQRFNEVGNKIGVVFAVEGLASLSAAQGILERAARLIGWADTTRTAVGNLRPPVEQADVDRDLTSARGQLDEATFVAAYAAGKAMTTDQALADALAEGPV